MSISELTTKSEAFARDFAEKHLAKSYLFHSINHIEGTVTAVLALGQAYQLSPQELENLVITMWFHDLGFYDGWKDHEERSGELAAQFLEEQKQPAERIQLIKEYIRATKRTEEPKNLIESIVCDADTSHIGSKDYFEILGKLRGEWENHNSKKFSEKEWLKLNIEFLNNHKFYTTIAQNNFGNAKGKHLLKLQRQLKNLKKIEKNRKKASEDDSANLTVKKSERGVETMFRVTLRNHNNLSRIADNKANIMLSINAIMLSIVVSSLVPNLSSNPNFIVPTVILIIVCLISIILATLSTRPKITSAHYTDEKFLEKKFNILFFGNFYQIPLEKFEWGLKNLMQDDDLLYSSLSKDLYYLGLVLAKKYKYLNICYNVFMIGLLIATASFIISLTL